METLSFHQISLRLRLQRSRTNPHAINSQVHVLQDVVGGFMYMELLIYDMKLKE